MAKNEARNRVAAYRKTLTMPQSPQDGAAVEALLSLLEPTLVCALYNAPGTAEHAAYARNVELCMKRIDEYSCEAAQAALPEDSASVRARIEATVAAEHALPPARKIALYCARIAHIEATMGDDPISADSDRKIIASLWADVAKLQAEIEAVK